MNTLTTSNSNSNSIDTYRADFERAMQDAAGGSPVWLRQGRRAAFDRFASVGFPTRRDEEWRFTDIRPIVDTPFTLPGFEQQNVMAEQVGAALHPDLKAHRLVFVNGRFAPHLSALGAIPEGVLLDSQATRLGNETKEKTAKETEAKELEAALSYHPQPNQTPFAALNFALSDDGAYIHIPRNTVVEDPILLVFVSNPGTTPTASHPRVYLSVGENSQATVVESYVGVGTGLYFTNAVTEIQAGANAVIDHYKLNRESDLAFHVATTDITLGRSANFTSHSITLGGQIVRNDFNANLRAEGIECTLNGLYLAHDRQLIDNHTSIDHAMPHCNSHELYKGIIDDRARGVFNGKIFVRQDAQKTDAKQTNQTLLLSEEATINTKPQLEIYADDVRCTHGATVGQLSNDALFYLRSRGIGKDEARAMLTFAFANDVVRRIQIEPIRAELESALLAQLRRIEYNSSTDSS